MIETVRYLLPVLLQIPIHHFEHYLIYLEVRDNIQVDFTFDLR